MWRRSSLISITCVAMKMATDYRLVKQIARFMGPTWAHAPCYQGRHTRPQMTRTNEYRCLPPVFLFWYNKTFESWSLMYEAMCILEYIWNVNLVAICSGTIYLCQPLQPICCSNESELLIKDNRLAKSVCKMTCVVDPAVMCWTAKHQVMGSSPVWSVSVCHALSMNLSRQSDAYMRQ